MASGPTSSSGMCRNKKRWQKQTTQ